MLRNHGEICSRPKKTSLLSSLKQSTCSTRAALRTTQGRQTACLDETSFDNMKLRQIISYLVPNGFLRVSLKELSTSIVNDILANAFPPAQATAQGVNRRLKQASKSTPTNIQRVLSGNLNTVYPSQCMYDFKSNSRIT